MGMHTTKPFWNLSMARTSLVLVTLNAVVVLICYMFITVTLFVASFWALSASGTHMHCNEEFG